MLGAQSIKAGENSFVVAGGMENMSQIPYYLPKARYGFAYGHGQVMDGLVLDGLTDVYNQCAMGVCADKTADKYEISREEQDRFAIQSYTRAAAATDSGEMANEIVPVSVLNFLVYQQLNWVQLPSKVQLKKLVSQVIWFQKLLWEMWCRPA